MRQLKIQKSITDRNAEKALDKYLQEVGKIPLIDQDREVELALTIRTSKDENERQSAIDELVNSNLRFVISVSKQYQNQGLTLLDLIDEGNLGLIKAAVKFDETRGFKFISYAVWWIRQQIMQAINEQARIVRLPLNQVSNLSKYRKTMAQFEQEHERLPTEEELAKLLDLPREKIKDTARVSSKHVSYDATFSGETEGTLLDIIPDDETPKTDNLTNTLSLQEDIKRVFSTLTERESQILTMCFGLNGQKEYSLEEIAEEFGLTRERVRQIREKAIKRIKNSKRADLIRPYLD